MHLCGCFAAITTLRIERFMVFELAVLVTRIEGWEIESSLFINCIHHTCLKLFRLCDVIFFPVFVLSGIC